MANKSSMRRLILSARSLSFLSGMARVMDIYGGHYRVVINSDPWKRDRDAIASDWMAVGNDLIYARDSASQGPPEYKSSCNMEATVTDRV